MAKSKERERAPLEGGFIPGEVKAHFDVEDLNDEDTGKREWLLTSKATGEEFKIAHAYGDPLFWFELGLHAGGNQPQRRRMDEQDRPAASAGTGGQQTRIPPPGKRE